MVPKPLKSPSDPFSSEIKVKDLTLLYPNTLQIDIKKTVTNFDVETCNTTLNLDSLVV